MPPKRKTAHSTAGKTAKKAKSALTNNVPVFTKWLIKSEPESRIEKGVDVKFSFDDLEAEPGHTTCWDGVRNYQARNFMRDQMKLGHQCFFYHSNCKEPGIVGIVEVVKEGYVDHTQFDKKDPHYDNASTREKPKWMMVDVKYVRRLDRFVSLKELKSLHLEHKKNGGALQDIYLFTRARLSVQPLTEDEFNFILSLEKKSVIGED